MTKKLEELLNLPEISSKMMEDINDNIKTTMKMDELDATLPIITGMDGTYTELDELAKIAIDTFQDFRDLAMNSDPRNAAAVIQAAATFLGHAVTAKIAKLDKKIKMIDLQIKKEKADSISQKDKQNSEHEMSDKVLDRNEILKEISNLKQS